MDMFLKLSSHEWDLNVKNKIGSVKLYGVVESLAMLMI